MHNQKTNITNHQTGFTLVELMIAIVLGLIISAAVIQTYLSSKQTYRVTAGIGRIQENARFGHYFITKDLRQAGYKGCAGLVRNKLVGSPSNYLASIESVKGWDYNGTNSGDSFTLKTTPSVKGKASWTDDLPDFLNNNIIAGSDVLMFKTIVPVDAHLNNGNTTNNTTLTIDRKQTFPDDSIFMVGTCDQMALFQATTITKTAASTALSAETDGSPGNRSTDIVWQSAHTRAQGSKLYIFVKTYYFIALRNGATSPSLYRLRSNTPTDNYSLREELIDGVETLQLLYGVDTNNNDNNPDRYVSANQVANWDDVVSVRVGMLFHSPDTAMDTDQTDDYTLLDSIDFTHDKEDHILRYAVNSTVKLRNRGLNIQFNEDNQQVIYAN